MLTSSEFDKVVAGAAADKVRLYKEPLIKAMEEFGIDTKLRQAMFLAHIMVESGALGYVVENLNYSAQGLRRTFGKYYRNDQEALAHARQPQKIANRVYANRMDNGNEASGDGWRFRGRGLKQLTGKYNYKLASKDLGYDLLKDPSYLETPEGAARSAAWFWSFNNINKFADKKDIEGSTRAINGGLNGFEDRKKYYERALRSIDLTEEVKPVVKPAPVKGGRVAFKVIKRGSKGVEVEKIQTALDLEVDGKFGPMTEKAVKDFQTKAGVEATGVVDETTYNLLTK